MSSKNTVNSYGWVAKTFHWGMFLIIIGQFWLGKNFKEEQFEGMGLSKLHFSIGILILFLILLRFMWRAKNPVPEMPQGTGKLETFGAHGLHILFYILLIALPIAGVAIVQSKGFPVSVFELFTLPTFFAESKDAAELAETVHEIFAKSTFVAVLLHFTIAMYHHFVKKDDTFRRMWPGGK